MARRSRVFLKIGTFQCQKRPPLKNARGGGARPPLIFSRGPLELLGGGGAGPPECNQCLLRVTHLLKHYLINFSLCITHSPFLIFYAVLLRVYSSLSKYCEI